MWLSKPLCAPLTSLDCGLQGAPAILSELGAAEGDVVKLRQRAPSPDGSSSADDGRIYVTLEIEKAAAAAVAAGGAAGGAAGDGAAGAAVAGGSAAAAAGGPLGSAGQGRLQQPAAAAAAEGDSESESVRGSDAGAHLHGCSGLRCPACRPSQDTCSAGCWLLPQPRTPAVVGPTSKLVAPDCYCPTAPPHPPLPQMMRSWRRMTGPARHRQPSQWNSLHLSPPAWLLCLPKCGAWMRPAAAAARREQQCRRQAAAVVAAAAMQLPRLGATLCTTLPQARQSRQCLSRQQWQQQWQQQQRQQHRWRRGQHWRGHQGRRHWRQLPLSLQSSRSHKALRQQHLRQAARQQMARGPAAWGRTRRQQWRLSLAGAAAAGGVRLISTLPGWKVLPRVLPPKSWPPRAASCGRRG